MHYGVAPATAQLWPLRFDDLVGAADELQLFRDIAPERAEATATRRAGTFLRREHACFARFASWQGLASRGLPQRPRQRRIMLLAQRLRQLFLQGVDAFFRFAYLALRFFPQLFGALAELHALQFVNQRFQPVDFAGIRRHSLRE